jgi:hypothetical protein
MDAGAGVNAKVLLQFNLLMVRSISPKCIVRSNGNRPQGIQDQAPALRRKLMARTSTKQFVVCVTNDGYPAALEKRKIYIALHDPAAETRGLLRVVDESGDDYLYPKTLFREIALPDAVRKAVLSAA